MKPPVQVLRSRPDGELLTGIVSMIRSNTDLLVPGNRNSNKLRGNLVSLEVGGVAEGVASTPVFPGQEATKPINENYRLHPTGLNKIILRLDKSLHQRSYQTVKAKLLDSFVPEVVKTQRHQLNTAAILKPQVVSCLVVSHAHSVVSAGLHKRKVSVPLY